MCQNKTIEIIFNCEGNLELKSLLIFIFSGLFMIISLGFTIFFFLSKPFGWNMN